MKDKAFFKKIDKSKMKKYIVIIAIVVVYILASVTISLVIRNKKGGPDVGVVVYGLSQSSEFDSAALKEGDEPVPYLMTNGKNNSVYYNAPLLNTGLVTETSKEEKSENHVPAMVVGEGTSRENTTVVRILNEQQACITQFLAYPPEVYGGVNVAAGCTTIDGKEVTLIATAAAQAYCDAARTVRVFDCNGMIYMEVTPKFYDNAPFAIATGHFVENDKNEYLLVASGYVEKGKVEANIYSLADGEIVKKLKLEVGKEHDQKQVFVSTRNNSDGIDSLIVFIKGDAIPKKIPEEGLPQYTNVHAIFEAYISGKLSKTDINIPTDAEYVYSSANENERYLITSNGKVYEEFDSYYYAYGENDRDGKLVRLDAHESSMYWNINDEHLDLNTISKEDEKYIRYADKLELSIDADGDVNGLTASVAGRSAYWRLKLTDYNLYPIKSAYKEIAEAYKANPEAVVAIELFSDEVFSDILNELYALNDVEDSEIEEYVITEELKYKMALRINRLYSEALLAGIPPEAITSNLILDNFVSNDSDETDKDEDIIKSNCLIDGSQLYSFGVPFGTVTTGTWYIESTSPMVLAKKSGYKNYTISSYASNTANYDVAFYQLLYMLRNGCRYVEIDCAYRDYAAVELNALQLLNDNNESRLSYANKSYSAVAVNHNGKSYNIVCLGGSTSNGMLKSVNADGSHEGSVYVVPFHAKVDVQTVTVKDNPRYEKAVKKFENVNAGSQLELTFEGKYKGDGGSVKIDVYDGDKKIEDACVSYQLSDEKQYYRYVFSTQYDIEELRIEIGFVCENYSAYKISDINLSLQQVKVANLNYGKLSGSSAFGGVSVDILDRESVYNK